MSFNRLAGVSIGSPEQVSFNRLAGLSIGSPEQVSFNRLAGVSIGSPEQVSFDRPSAGLFYKWEVFFVAWAERNGAHI